MIVEVVDLTNLTSADVEVLVSPEVWERGRAYQQQGYVVAAFRLAACLAGQVLGEYGVYHPRLWVEAGKLRGECNCPYPSFCKHLVALALTWLEQRGRFRDLQPELENLLRQPELLPETLQRLVAKDPVNFGEILTDQGGKTDEPIDRRALIALTRRLFEHPLVNQSDVERLWERLQRTRQWLTDRLPEGSPDLLELLINLLNGVLLEYRQNDHQMLRSYLSELLELVLTLPQYYEAAALSPLGQVLGAYYFNPEYWELAADLRRVLVAFSAQDPSAFRACLCSGPEKPVSLLEQIAQYELLAALPEEVKPVYQTEYQQVVGALQATVEGRLWFIDRLLETDRINAKKIIVSRLKEAGEAERSLWRERLIRLHLLNQEWQQAASLIMIQFQEEPSFEGYLRLKDCLINCHPGDWERRLLQIRDLLNSRGDRGLWLRIVIDRQDEKQIISCLDELVAHPDLLDCLTETIQRQTLPSLAPVYPVVIRSLLNRENVNDWQQAWQTAAIYKKLCYRQQLRPEWEKCRAQLLESLDAARSKSLQRFGGAILSS